MGAPLGQLPLSPPEAAKPLQAMPVPQPVPSSPLVQAPSPVANQDYLAKLRTMASNLPPLNGWNIVMLTEPEWTEFRRKLQTAHPNEQPTDRAFSIQGANHTYVRQNWLDSMRGQDDRIQHMLAHEHWHLSSGSLADAAGERSADKWADEWMREQRRAEALRQFKGGEVKK